MSKFFELTTQHYEKKEITRLERITTDNFAFANHGNYGIPTDSKAPRQKMKFFLDMVQYLDGPVPFFYRVGQYFELEHNQWGQFLTERGYVWFRMTCSENDGNGNFVFNIHCEDEHYTIFFISQIVLQDSFYNPASGWLNPDNPGNYLDRVQTQKLPGVRRMDLTYQQIVYWIIVTKWNQCYKIYEDDFVTVGWFSNAAANRIFFVIPKGIFAIKDIPFDNLTTVQNPKNYRKSGSLILSTGAVLYRPNTPTEEWTAALVNAITPGDEAPGGMEIPKDTLCFSFNLAANAYHNATMFWEAEDGYTYGLKIEFIQNGATTAAINYNINLVYLGRNQTGEMPVVEGGI